jgi:hypothetical protein
MTKSLTNLLPSSLYPIIQPYLSCLDYLLLMNTSKSAFGEIKRDTVWYIFNDMYGTRDISGSQYLRSIIIQENILKKIKNPGNQLNIYLAGCGLKDPSSSFRLGFVPEFPMLPHPVRSLHLLNCYIDDAHVSFDMFFPGVKELEIESTNSTSVGKFPVLPALEKLTLWNFRNLSTVSSFSCLKELFLSRCDNLVDVSPLSKLSTLYLSFCNQVIDISPLRNIPSLTFHYCSGITNISCLTKGRVEKIKILDCDSILSYEPLKRIKNVFLSILPSKLPLFEESKVLAFKTCGRVTNFIQTSPILYSLYFERLLALTSLSFGSFCSLTKITLIECHAIKDLSSLKNMYFIEIRRCYHIHSLDSFLGEKNVKLIFEQNTPITIRREGEDMAEVLKPPLLDLQLMKAATSLKYLHLTACHIISVKYCANLHTVILERCKELNTIHMLYRVFHVELISCPQIRSLEKLENVSEIIISDCSSLQSLEGLSGQNKKIVLDDNRENWWIYDKDWLKERYTLEILQSKRIYLQKKEYGSLPLIS